MAELIDLPFGLWTRVGQRKHEFSCICQVIIIIIIIIINDNVYGAVIVTMVTARVHPVHLMNAD